MSTREQSRRSPLHDEWAVKVKTRADWKCEGCGMSRAEIEEHGGRLEAAHILPHSEYPEERYKLTNGRALCTFRNRQHPQGLGNGYGCHNAMSGHWGHAYGTVPATGGNQPSRYGLAAGTALMATALLLVYAVFFAGWRAMWLLEASWAAAGSMAFLSTKHRHGWGVIDLGSLTWMILVAGDAMARYRWRWGVGASPFHTLLLAAAVSLAACLALAHLALTHHWISRSARASLHGVVRLVSRMRGQR